MELRVNQEIKIETDIPLTSVADFRIRWEVNRHASLRLQGDLSYEEALKCQNDDFSNRKVAVKYDHNNREYILFHGYIKELELLFEGQTATLQLECISASWKLDIMKKSRSFQNEDITYAALAKQIAADAKADTIAICGKDQTISGALIQCQETDWEFLVRLSSQLNKFIISDVSTGKPAFWFGMRKGAGVTLITEHVQTEMFDQYTKEVIYKINSKEVYELGDWTEFKGRRLIVLDRTVCFHQQELMFTYTLGQAAYLEQQIQFNKTMQGRGFCGIVKQVSGEMIKIELAIDDNRESILHWYPWIPETGNIMYAMPEIGSPAVLTIPGRDERDAVIRVCLHQDGAQSNRSRLYSKRRLKISEAATLKFYPDKLEFTKKQGAHSIKIEDGVGIALETNKGIRIEAKKNIFCNGSRVMIAAEDEISGVVG